MDVIELVKRKNNWELPQTLEWLTEKAGVSKSIESIKPIVSTNCATDFEQMKSSFLASPLARNYTETRNLDRSKLEIGYNAFKQSKFSYLRGCITFGLRDKTGKVVSMYGRSVRDNDKSKHYYTPNRTGLYPNYPPAETKKIILTESIVDTATLQGIASITKEHELLALYGTNGLTAEHTTSISQLKNLEEIILFLDGDQGGKTASQKHGKYLKELFPNLTISIVDTLENEDINSISATHKDDKVFTQLLKNRKPFFLSIEKPIVEKEAIKNKKIAKSSKPTSILELQVKGNLSKSDESLKVTIEAVNKETGKKLRDKVELYEFKQVDRFIKLLTEKLGVSENLADEQIHQLIDKLEQKRDLKREALEQSKIEEKPLSSYELEQCQRFGQQANLMKKLNGLIGQSGIVGEEKNRLFLFCIASSHRMKKTLNVVVQGSSGSGKTHLIKKVSDLMPQQRVKRFTRITEKSFYNYGEFDLVNRLIVLEDYDGMKEEAEFALRELQSNEQLISSTSKKDEVTGEIKSGENIVRGPIASMVATTQGEMYHDNSTRVFFIIVDESKEQTKAIIKYKNQLSAGEIDKQEAEKATVFVQNFICSLKPLAVKNTWLKHIDLPVNLDQQRRLHSLFEAFCEQVTLLHQHGRKRDKQGRVITEKQDVETAIELMFESIVLKVDELNGRLRDFYEKVKEYVEPMGKDYEFTRLEIRQYAQKSTSQVRRDLDELQEMEYIQKSHSSKHNTFAYKIAYWNSLEALRKRLKETLTKQLSTL